LASPVIVTDYDPSWPELFQALRERIADALSDIAAAIEHVGSTAVPGLAAKPVIDIDVLLSSADLLTAAIDRLAFVGYVYQGDLGIPGREAFLAPVNDYAHHLYVCPPGSEEYRKHIAFRDYLRTHAKEATLYGALKRTLALQFRDDRSMYTMGKSAFIGQITNRAMKFQPG
jgi:GrpB-like predicted nucleotidyltransferase (UPF0157 family)